MFSLYSRPIEFHSKLQQHTHTHTNIQTHTHTTMAVSLLRNRRWPWWKDEEDGVFAEVNGTHAFDMRRRCWCETRVNYSFFNLYEI